MKGFLDAEKAGNGEEGSNGAPEGQEDGGEAAGSNWARFGMDGFGGAVSKASTPRRTSSRGGVIGVQRDWFLFIFLEFYLDIICVRVSCDTYCTVWPWWSCIVETLQVRAPGSRSRFAALGSHAVLTLRRCPQYSAKIRDRFG